MTMPRKRLSLLQYCSLVKAPPGRALETYALQYYTNVGAIEIIACCDWLTPCVRIWLLKSSLTWCTLILSSVIFLDSNTILTSLSQVGGLLANYMYWWTVQKSWMDGKNKSNRCMVQSSLGKSDRLNRLIYKVIHPFFLTSILHG